MPSERFPENTNDDRPIQYGMPLWRDLFSPRQLLCHGTSVEVYREMLEADRAAGELSGVQKAAYGYLAIALDTLLNYNNRASRWVSTTGTVRSIFDRHDFAFVWSYAEMAPLVTGVGYDWAIDKTAKCIKELVELVNPEGQRSDLFAPEEPHKPPPVTITCKSADSLDHIESGSIDAVVMDPPYYDNVMYAELSDFFYVWLKRTAGHVFPELFRRQLTDKENEAVANPARFAGEKGARALAGRDYQERMAAIFRECRRVLKADGIMTLMFTHKATGAWDALAKGLMEAGFVITGSWPINTEAGGSLHIRDKAAANSTVFLACRPRPAERAAEARDAVAYWEDVEPRVAEAVRTRVAEFQQAGIAGVDLYLACFGPALEEFSRNWPLTRGTPRERPVARRRGQQDVLEDDWDPYAATPEDALDAARREVKRWRLEQLTRKKASEDLDAPTAFFVLAWDAFKAPVFAYDEALRLARAVGVDMDAQVAKRLGEKRGGDFRLWDSATRAAKGALGPVDGSRGLVDTLHHAASVSRNRSLAAARDMLAETGMGSGRAPVPGVRGRAGSAAGVPPLHESGAAKRGRRVQQRFRGAVRPCAAGVCEGGGSAEAAGVVVGGRRKRRPCLIDAPRHRLHDVWRQRTSAERNRRIHVGAASLVPHVVVHHAVADEADVNEQALAKTPVEVHLSVFGERDVGQGRGGRDQIDERQGIVHGLGYG